MAPSLVSSGFEAVGQVASFAAGVVAAGVSVLTGGSAVNGSEPELLLHHGPPTRSVRPYWLLTELGVPFKVERHDFLGKPETIKNKAYAALNPLQTLPTLISGDTKLFESGAIVQWILEKYDTKHELSPEPGTPQHAEYLKWFWFAEATFGDTLLGLLNHAALLPEEARVAAEVGRYSTALAALLSLLDGHLKGKQYLLGDAFSAADIMLGQMLYLAVNFAKAIPEATYPTLAAYYARISARPGFIKAYAEKNGEDPEVVLFHAPPSRSVRPFWLMKELGVPFKVKPCKIMDPSTYKTDEVAAITPLQALPALTCGQDVKLFESGAIVQWLLEKYDGGHALSPEPGTPEHAEFLKWVWFAEATFADSAASAITHAMFLPEDQRVPAEAARHSEAVKAQLAVLEGQLKGKKYLLGDAFSAADIMVGQMLWIVVNFMKALPKETFPALAAYYARLAARKGFKEAYAALPKEMQEPEPELVLYHGAPTRSVRPFWALTELDVPFKVDHRDVFKPETFKTEEFGEINPLKSLPALTCGDVKLWESGAIMQWVLEKYDTEHKLSPAEGTPQHAEYLKWFWFAEATFGDTLLGLLQHAALLPEEARVPAEAARHSEALAKLLGLLEGHLAGKKFLLGDTFSAADIMLGQMLYLAFNFAKAMPPVKYPELITYYARISTRPGFVKAYAPAPAPEPELVLYHGAPTRSVRPFWALTELGVPFKVDPRDVFKPETFKTEEFGEINPLKSLPALTYGDVKLWESGAIMQWVLEKYDTEHKLSPPEGTPQHAEYLKWFWFAEATFGDTLLGLLQHAALLPEEARVPAEAARHSEALAKLLGLLDGHLAGKQYLLGEAFSAADIMLGQMLYLAVNFAKAIPEATYPTLAAYYARISERPGFVKAYAPPPAPEPELVLYHGAPTRSVRPFWLMKELGVPFKVDPRDVFKPETFKTEEFGEINPLKSLPALTCGDVKLWESGAIMQWLLEKYDTEHKLAPEQGTPQHAEYLKWFWFSEATFGDTLLGLLSHAALLPEEARVPAEAARHSEALGKLLGVLEGHLQGKQYLLGEGFSAADIMLGQMLYLAVNFAKAIPEATYPTLAAYYARISARPGFEAAYAPAEEPKQELVLSHCPPTRSVRPFWLLKEMDVPFKVDKRDLFKPETFKTEEYAAINPLQALPALTCDDIKLWESGAIVQWLLEKYDVGHKFSPEEGTPQHAEYLKWFWFAEHTFGAALVHLLNHAALLPEEARVAGEAERFQGTLTAMLYVLEAHLKGKQYLLGDVFSAADIMLGQMLYLAINFAKAIPSKLFPATIAYYERLSTRPGFVAAYK